MHILLTPELQNIIHEKVKSGYYSNASEVVRDAIRRMHEQDVSGLLQREVAKGFVQLNSGKAVAFDIEKSKKAARKNAKAGKKVKAVVTPIA